MAAVSRGLDMTFSKSARVERGSGDTGLCEFTVLNAEDNTQSVQINLASVVFSRGGLCLDLTFADIPWINQDGNQHNTAAVPTWSTGQTDR